MASTIRIPVNAKRKDVFEPRLHGIISKRLQVMDATATILCMDNRIPLIVFNLDVYGNIEKLSGRKVGTFVGRNAWTRHSVANSEDRMKKVSRTQEGLLPPAGRATPALSKRLS